MEKEIIRVSHHFWSDLCFRIRNAKLQHEYYSIDYFDWVKAGIAYNISGTSDINRSIDYFCSLYDILSTDSKEDAVAKIRASVTMFYEDLYSLYLDHISVQFKVNARASRGKQIMADSLILLPKFDAIPELSMILPKADIKLVEYECKHVEDFENNRPAASVVSGSPMYRCMSLMFDYGVKKQDNGTLLEVT